MKRILSLVVAFAMVIAMVPSVFAANDSIDMDELLGKLVKLDSIDEIKVSVPEGPFTKTYKWTPEKDGTLSVTFYEWELPEGTQMDITMKQGENSVTYSQMAEDAEFALEVEAGVAVSIVVSKTSEAALETTFYGFFTEPEGTENNPVFLFELQNTVTTSFENTWFQGYFSGTTMTVTGTGAYNVTVNGEATAAVDGVVTMDVVTPNPRMPFIFAIDQVGEYTIEFAYPAGSQMNPTQLVIGENTAEIAEGSQGYYYTWTAEEGGTLTITMPEGNWSYVINNLTSFAYGDTQWSDSDPVVNPAVISVMAGDEIELVVNTYDPENMWSNPAGTLVVTAAFEVAANSETNPIIIEPVWNDDYTSASATVTAPVGTTYYGAYGFGGMMLSINGGEPVLLESDDRLPAVFAITNEGAGEKEYTLVFTPPLGSYNNPAPLVMGENTATVEEGSWSGYLFNWTAEADGKLTITMPEGNWFYVINNLTTGIYGDSQWSDSDPVVNPAVVNVKAGDKIELSVNTYDPANMWSNPAGTLVITASFEEAAAYTPGDLDGNTTVDEDDVIYLLQHLLMGDDFPLV